MEIKKFKVSEMYALDYFHELVAEYAAECAIDGMPAPEYRMQSYLSLEEAGALASWGAFADGRLIGFVVTVSPVIPHYGMTVTVIESIFVAKAYRHTGAGIRLEYVAADYAQSIGSPGIMANSPHDSEFAEVLPRMGYVPVSRSFFRKF